MNFLFAWRYFKAKKSTNAINIISWITVSIIAIAICCQLLVLSVFNGFEGLVKSLYADFYTDIKITPAKGKTFTISPLQLSQLKKLDFIQNVSLIAEDNALIKLQNEDRQKKIKLKGVDENYPLVCGLSSKIKTGGKYELGNADEPFIVVGAGIQNDLGINTSEALPLTKLTIILPKKNNSKTDIAQSLSEGIVTAKGAFTIQQEFDNSYGITNIDYVKQQMNFDSTEYSSAEIKIKNKLPSNAQQQIDNIIFNNTTKTLTRYQQNTTLYNTMLTEKWFVYAVLTLILILAAFTMISALTMLVLEKQKDISILQTMGTTSLGIQKIFLTEGLLLGIIGSISGILMAIIICIIQQKTHFIKLNGNSFLIDYFPVKMWFPDFLLVATTALIICFIAAWLPSVRAAKQHFNLK